MQVTQRNAKHLLALLSASLCLMAAPAQANDGEAIVKKARCTACHAVDQKRVGPAYKDVAKKYAGQKDAEARIASSIVKGTPVPAGVGWQKEGKATLPFMPPNATVKPDEATKLAKWILGLK